MIRILPDLPGLPAWVEGLKRPLKLGFAAALLTAAVSIFLPNHYRSEARILPVEARGAGGLGQLAAAAAAFGVGVPGQDGGDANYVDILNSRWMREGLLKTEFTFHARAWRFGADTLRRQTLAEYLEVKDADQGVQGLAAVISVSRDLKSKLLTITAETKSPELSQQIVQRAVKSLESFVIEKGRTRGGSKALFAEQRLKDSQKEYTQAEDEFRRFLEGNRAYQMSTDPTVRLRGARLEAELKLRQQLVTTLALSREQALMEEKNDVPILNVLDEGNLPINKSGPGRSRIVFLAFLAAAVATWVWSNRMALLAYLNSLRGGVEAV